jgi:hypothetical protein
MDTLPTAAEASIVAQANDSVWPKVDIHVAAIRKLCDQADKGLLTPSELAWELHEHVYAIRSHALGWEQGLADKGVSR